MPAKAEIEPVPFYSKGSERQPFSSYLNNTTTWTIIVIGLLGSIGLIQHSSQLGEVAKDSAAIGSVVLGTFRAMDRLREMHNENTEEVRRKTLQRVAEIGRNPLTIFRRTNRSISSS